VLSVIVTVCEPVYAPETGEMDGIAAAVVLMV